MPDPNEMPDIAEQLKIRDRFRRRLHANATPEERVRDMMKLQQMSWDLLMMSPEGYARFIRRNIRARGRRARENNAAGL